MNKLHFQLFNKDIIIKILYVILITFTLSNTSLANEEITISVMKNFPPFNFDQNGKQVGIDVDIVETVLTDIDVRWKYRTTSWQRALREFDNQQTDAIFQLVPTPKRFKKWSMAGPLRSNNRCFYVTRDSDLLHIKSYKDMKGLKVGIIYGFTFPKRFNTLLKHKIFDVVPAYELQQNIIRLAKGEVDIVVESELPFNYELSKIDPVYRNRIIQLQHYAEEDSRYIAFQKTEIGQDLARRFQKRLFELRNSGEINSIINKWQYKH